jgi:hypothetical protein
MALTNAEKQARWRERRNSKAARPTLGFEHGTCHQLGWHPEGEGLELNQGSGNEPETHQRCSPNLVGETMKDLVIAEWLWSP